MVTQLKRTQFNPIRGLTPELLSSQLDSFSVGRLTAFAMTADAIRRRDDVINPALSKREKAPARRSWSIQLVEGLSVGKTLKAEKHREALQYCFDNLEITSALEQNECGGFRLLVRQMMAAVGMKFSVHEIIWKPQIDQQSGQPGLTAKLVHAPLWLFENMSGRLRFLSQIYGYEGQEMTPDEWLVTVGDGILEPLAVAYMFKQMSLKDWVSYNDKFGMPGIQGITDAAKDSPEWEALEDAVDQFSQDWAIVTNRGAEIKLIEARGGTSLPFQPLVERMDRAMATICRGADLSTMSAGAGSGQGASVQGEETDLLEEDDAEMVTEALAQLSKVVIEWTFGPGTTPLAFVQIVIPKKKTTDDTIKKLDFCATHGIPVGQSYVRQELGVPAPAKDEELITSPAPAASPFGQPFNQLNAANVAQPNARFEVFRSQALRQVTEAQAAALRPLTDRLSEILGIEDEATQDAALLKLQNDMPGLLKSINADPQLATVWQNIFATALVSGATDAAQGQQKKTTTS